MAKDLSAFLAKETTNLQHAGLFKTELAMDQKRLINLASNDYLGLSIHPAVIQAAKDTIDLHGAGTSSPRMIGGTRSIHRDLEVAISRFLGTQETLLFSSRYHANTGLFESLFDDRDWIFCDELAHPSVADGLRLSKARVIGYRNNDMDHLEDRLKRSRAARFRVIVTDAMFPLEGRPADLAAIIALGERYDAPVFADDSHGIGVMGPSGRGTAEALGMAGQLDLVTATLTYAVGAGSGGFASGRREVIAWLRQKSRPYLVSSAPPPSSAAAALAALGILERDRGALETLRGRIEVLRAGLESQGYEVIESAHPIVVLMIGGAVATQRVTNALYQRGIYAVGFCHPVVPEGRARIRVQVSALLEDREVEAVLAAFEAARRVL